MEPLISERLDSDSSQPDNYLAIPNIKKQGGGGGTKGKTFAINDEEEIIDNF